jgi:hypothetical protein
MQRRPFRAWSLLAVLVALVALGAGAGGGPAGPRLLPGDITGITNQTTSGGVLDAVLRAEADRVESVLSTKSTSTARLVLLAAALAGVALLVLVAPRRRDVLLLDGAPLATRLRAWVGLRAPPSLLLVSRPY